MKNSGIYVAILLALLTNCGNSENTDDNVTIHDSSYYLPETTYVAVESATEYEEDEPRENIKSIDELFKDNKVATELSNSIKKAVANKAEIKTLKELEKVFELRDSLVDLLNSDKEFENYMLSIDAIWNYFETFEKIGISFVTAEGIYICLDRAPLLTDEVEKLADEPYKLKTKIENLFGSMQGGEYPFEDISKEIELIPLAEKLLTDYPGYKYNKEVAVMLDHALFALVDFHAIGDEDKIYLVGNYDTDTYPGMTNVSDRKEFIKKAKSSRFAKIVSNILSSPSNLGLGFENKLYYITVPSLDSNNVFADENLNNALKNLPEDIKNMDDGFKYLWLGIDVAHTLIFEKNEKYTYVLAYRYYDEKRMALKSLAKIRKIIPNARLIEHPFSD